MYLSGKYTIELTYCDVNTCEHNVSLEGIVIRIVFEVNLNIYTRVGFDGEMSAWRNSHNIELNSNNQDYQ